MKLKVRRGLQVHHWPQALLPQIMPVTRTPEQRRTATLAAAAARSSHFASRVAR